MVSALQTAIYNAWDQQSDELAIRDVKTIIAREMNNLDSSIEITPTDHFNHSLFPDFVLTWREGNVTERRDVFLRHNATSILFQDGHRILSGDQVFLGIEANHTNPDIRRELSSALRGDTECLVSDAGTLDRIAVSEHRWQQHSVVLPTVAAKTWIRGARGLLDEPAAAELTDQVASGDTAMVAGSTKQASDVVSAVRRSYRSQYAKRIERVMQLMWLSGGNPLTEFPGRHSMSTKLSEAEIQRLIPFLLASSRADDEFWRLVGEVVDLRLLQALGDVGESENFDRLVNVNIDRLPATQVMMRRREPTLLPDLDRPRWSVKSGLLTLGAEGFNCHVTDDKRKLANARYTTWHTHLQDVQTRLDRYHLKEIAFSSPAATIDVKSASAKGLHGAQANELTESFGSLGKISKLAVRMADWTKDVIVNFGRGTAESDEGPVSLPTLILVAADLIYQSDAQLLEALRPFLGLANEGNSRQ